MTADLGVLLYLYGGCVFFTIFAFLGLKSALAKLHRVGLDPSVIGRQTQSFPRIGHERLDHIRALDAEATLPARGHPTTVERYVIQGQKPGAGAL